MGSNTFCCCECEQCCKPNTPTLGCICCAIRIVPVTVCIKAQAQCCCIVEACALPTDDEVPCMCAACGITCYPTFSACCKKMEEVVPDSALVQKKLVQVQVQMQAPPMQQGMPMQQPMMQQGMPMQQPMGQPMMQQGMPSAP